MIGGDNFCIFENTVYKDAKALSGVIGGTPEKPMIYICISEGSAC